MKTSWNHPSIHPQVKSRRLSHHVHQTACTKCCTNVCLCRQHKVATTTHLLVFCSDEHHYIVVWDGVRSLQSAWAVSPENRTFFEHSNYFYWYCNLLHLQHNNWLTYIVYTLSLLIMQQFYGGFWYPASEHFLTSDISQEAILINIENVLWFLL